MDKVLPFIADIIPNPLLAALPLAAVGSPLPGTDLLAARLTVPVHHEEPVVDHQEEIATGIDGRHPDEAEPMEEQVEPEPMEEEKNDPPSDHDIDDE